ncbi:MAG: hypothetical protein AAF616_14515 [Bacteroidota bacterium]
MKNIYSKTGIVKTFEDGAVIKVLWSLLSNKTVLYESCKAQLEAVERGQVEVIIVDVSNAQGTPPLEIQEWFGDILFPSLKACKQFKGLVNVLPYNAITRMGAKHWKKTAESDRFGFLVYETDTMESAEKLAKEMIANNTHASL